MALLIVWSFGCCSFQGTKDINGVICSNYASFLSQKNISTFHENYKAERMLLECARGNIVVLKLRLDRYL